MPGPRNRPGPAQTAGSSAVPAASGTTQANPAPAGTRAWSDLRNALSNHLPLQLETSRHSGLATLRLIARRHKVGR